MSIIMDLSIAGRTYPDESGSLSQCHLQGVHRVCLVDDSRWIDLTRCHRQSTRGDILPQGTVTVDWKTNRGSIIVYCLIFFIQNLNRK